MEIHDLKLLIESKNIDCEKDLFCENLQLAIQKTINLLNSGVIRVAEKINNQWVTHLWVKKAIMMYFAISKNTLVSTITNSYDKIPLKFIDYTAEMFLSDKTRVVHGAVVRYGAYIGHNSVIMPSFVNIGANIGSGTMIDTWATIGSCAQIGNNVHISGGVGIGGVLEPIQNSPTIIEDNCFIGARSEIVEGVVVETGAVISMGVYIGQSTKIYHKEEDKIIYGKIPPFSVVIPGSIPDKSGKFNTNAAIIIKQVAEITRKKTSINELLRINT